MTASESDVKHNLATHSPEQARRNMIALMLVMCLLAAVYLLLAASTYQGSADLHATIEVVGALFGLVAGTALVTRFYALGNRFHLFIGLAFFVNGAEDFIHGLMSFRNLFGLPASSLAQFIPGTYVTGRMMLGVILILAPFMSTWLGESKSPKREAKWVSSIILLITLALTTLAYYTPLPKFIYPDRLISRPVDFLSAVVLFVALFAFLKEYRQGRDMLTWWVALSIAVNLVGQVMMSFSKSLYDPFFDIAHLYKVLGYAIPLLGFSFYQIAVITERMRAEAGLRRSQEETLHGQRLLLTLSQAAQAVQRAHTPDDVYRIVGDEVTKLDFNAAILTLTADRSHLTISYMTFKSGLLRVAEKLVGASAKDHLIFVEPGGFYDRLLSEGLPVFLEHAEEPLTESLPKAALPLAGRLTTLMNLGKAVYAPLVIGSEAVGFLMVTGIEFSEIDVPAVTAFANQTAIALENTRLYQESRAWADELEQRVTKRTQELKAAQIAALNMMDDLEREVEERKRAEGDLAGKAEELERSNKELEQFAYVASHDLQEPLRMVASYLQLLERRYGDKLDQDAKEFIEFSVDGATRMKNLINDLLAYSRVGTRGGPFQPINLNHVLGQVHINLRASIEESGTLISQAEMPTVMADETQMVQLFQNLIGNAIKFRKAEQIPQISINVSEVDKEWLFSVQDNGIGFDPQFAERIFVIFQRLHPNHEFSGTGIGLAVSKRIVERHGGRIWVESQPGEGATFYFTIPKNGSRQ